MHRLRRKRAIRAAAAPISKAAALKTRTAEPTCAKPLTRGSHSLTMPAMLKVTTSAALRIFTGMPTAAANRGAFAATHMPSRTGTRTTAMVCSALSSRTGKICAVADVVRHRPASKDRQRERAQKRIQASEGDVEGDVAAEQMAVEVGRDAAGSGCQQDHADRQIAVQAKNGVQADGDEREHDHLQDQCKHAGATWVLSLAKSDGLSASPSPAITTASAA